ncbi:MAG: hypothetical protein HKL90_09895 [Elusimicrobia bacterium]|nr:hypothetical protein [Elusimicrobiota bacterium]
MKQKPGSPPVAASAEERFGPPLDYPYLLGAYLAVNAVSDLGIFVDGPDCAIGKAEHVFGAHDRRSTLLDAAGASRVAFSGQDLRRAALARPGDGEDAAVALARQAGVAAVIVDGLPLCLVAGADYAARARVLENRVKKPFLALPRRSLNADWLDGYDAVLTALARRLPLDAGPRSERRVALVGLLFDRNEEDRRADVAELARTLAALDFELVSTWPCGGDVRGLSAAGTAGTILSLPYARVAARALTERVGARLIELELPVGLEGSRRWVATLGAATGRQAAAGAFIDAELRETSPRLERGAVGLFQGRKAALCADPHFLPGLAEWTAQLGLTTALAASVGRLREGGADRLSGRASLMLERPTSGLLRAAWARARAEGATLLVGSSDARRAAGGGAWTELGFPSRTWHALTPQPTLGFAGALALAQRLADGILDVECSSGARP